MPYEFHCQQRVEFADTDMAGIVHFSNFFRYMEVAEHEFLRSLGLSVHGRPLYNPDRGDGAGESPIVSWPRVNAECSYRSPLSFEDTIDIHLLVREKRSKSVTYEFRFRKEGAAETAAVGSITAVCVCIDRASGRMSAIAIPDAIDRLIEVAPQEMFKTSR